MGCSTVRFCMCLRSSSTWTVKMLMKHLKEIRIKDTVFSTIGSAFLPPSPVYSHSFEVSPGGWPRTLAHGANITVFPEFCPMSLSRTLLKSLPKRGKVTQHEPPAGVTAKVWWATHTCPLEPGFYAVLMQNCGRITGLSLAKGHILFGSFFLGLCLLLSC